MTELQKKLTEAEAALAMAADQLSKLQSEASAIPGAIQRAISGSDLQELRKLQLRQAELNPEIAVTVATAKKARIHLLTLRLDESREPERAAKQRRDEGIPLLQQEARDLIERQKMIRAEEIQLHIDVETAGRELSERSGALRQAEQELAAYIKHQGAEPTPATIAKAM